MVLAVCAVVADFPVFFSMRDGPVGAVDSRAHMRMDSTTRAAVMPIVTQLGRMATVAGLSG